MKENYRIEKTSLLDWMVKKDDAERVPGIDERCTIENVQAFLDKRIANCTVVKAEVVADGIYQANPATYLYADSNLPSFFQSEGAKTFPVNMNTEFCLVEVEYRTLAGVETISLALPTVWNGRFFGVGGGGTFTAWTWEMSTWPDYLNPQRTPSPDLLVKNGFATAWTDGAIPDDKMVFDPTDPETGAFNAALVRNYDYVAYHNRNVIGKLVCEALAGEKPKYSYSQGGSGGGRANLRMAQRCPDDLDGIWAENPYFPYHNASAAVLWAMVVLHESGDYMPYAKLNAFREAALARYGGLEGWLKVKDRPEFDARECIGSQTEAGEITELDAKVMNLIWDGPRRKDGTSIRRGWRPGSIFWGNPTSWFNYIFDDDGNPIDIPNYVLGTLVYSLWVKRGTSFDWHDLTMDTFEEWYDSFWLGLSELDVLDEDADLTRLVKTGCKLIISIGTEDDYGPCDGIVDYYNEVSRVTFKGNIPETRKHVRLFLQPGNSHAMQLMNDGCGSCFADSMIALMRWVEDGIAPDTIPAVHIDPVSGQVDREGEISVF